MTQQLTKPKAQELLKDLQYAKAQMGQLSTKEEYYKQALERLIPLWHEDEQREQGGDGWIEWGGGVCPFKDDLTVIEVKFGCGDVVKDFAGAWWWGKSGDEDDIIAYRIIPEQPTNQNGEQ